LLHHNNKICLLEFILHIDQNEPREKIECFPWFLLLLQ